MYVYTLNVILHVISSSELWLSKVFREYLGDEIPLTTRNLFNSITTLRKTAFEYVVGKEKKRAMMALDCSPEKISTIFWGQLNKTCDDKLTRKSIN